MPQWFKNIARLNPVTWYLDATRSILAGRVDWGFMALTIAFAASLAIVTYGLAMRAFVRLND
jgi:ABC-type multidrug transport system permease subunit